MVIAMLLIVGLGNPGPKYIQTRHNIGFMVADAIAAHTRLHFAEDRPASTSWLPWGAGSGRQPLAMSAQGTYGGQAFTLIKPLTYMNRSGEAVAHYVRSLQLALPDVLVIFDDISLPVGVVRLRKKGGAGGHNGVQHIIDHLGSTEFPRLRFGVGQNYDRGQQVEYVLSPFAPNEQDAVETAMTRATDAVLTFLREGIDIAMNRFNRRE
jgi:PTH1 family peptidyl-tRNA hydrolase